MDAAHYDRYWHIAAFAALQQFVRYWRVTADKVAGFFICDNFLEFRVDSAEVKEKYLKWDSDFISGPIPGLTPPLAKMQASVSTIGAIRSIQAASLAALINGEHRLGQR